MEGAAPPRVYEIGSYILRWAEPIRQEGRQDVVNFIEISVSKRKASKKIAEIEEAYRIRDAEILAYEKKNPFSYLSWYEAWKCGWLRQRGLNIHSFPSPVLHHKKMWKKSNNPFFKAWREESRKKHQIFLQELRNKP